MVQHYLSNEYYRHQWFKKCAVKITNSAGLHEERAVLLGCLGQHHQALAIYIHTLGDTDAALNYCRKHYSSSGSGSEVRFNSFCLILFWVPKKHWKTEGIIETMMGNLFLFMHVHTYTRPVFTKRWDSQISHTTSTFWLVLTTLITHNHLAFNVEGNVLPSSLDRDD